jgi:hypothetical protein
MPNFAKDTLTKGRSTRHVPIYGSAIALLLALNPIATPSVCADDQPLADESSAIRRMNQQIQELQAKVNELEARLNGVTGGTSHGDVAVSAAADAPSDVTPTPQPPSAAQEWQDDNAIPSVKLRMIGDMGYKVSDQHGKTNSFHISDRVSVLGEVLFISREGNVLDTDVERLLLQYKHSDYLNFAIGRYHSSIGYYNTTFHQGAWFQTTVDRPFMYTSDDEGGFLPLQEVGVTINGQIPSGRLGLNYVAEIGNGRFRLLGSEPAQNFQDTNNGKSLNFALYARPSWLPGWQTGFSIYHDYLTFSDNMNHGELISTVHVVYTSSNYEFLNEVMLVRHTGNITGAPRVFHTPGFYTQFSRRFGKYRPYFRYSYLNAGMAEPIFGDPADGPIVGQRNGPTLGLRYDLNEHSTSKLQYNHLAQRGQENFNELLTQFSFAF